MQHHAISHPTPVPDNHIRMEHTILANLNLFSQKYTRIKNGPSSDTSALAHKDMREHPYTSSQIRSRIETRFRTNLLLGTRRRVKHLQNSSESNIWVCRFQIVPSFFATGRLRNDTGAYDNRTRLTGG